MRKLLAMLDRLEEGLMAAVLAGMTALTALQVLLRYAFNSGFVWSLEATMYSFAWLVLLGISYGVRKHSHIAVDLLVSRLSGSVRMAVTLLALAICLAYAVLMFYGAAIFVQKLYYLGNEARDIPLARWVLTAILPFGFALLGLRFAALGLSMWRSGEWSLGFADQEHAHVLPDQEDEAQ
jgi:C4-dicarboxylate transporter DctQ subunit